MAEIFHYYVVESSPYISIAGVAISLLGFLVAICQIRRTAIAAIASQNAAERALKGVEHIQAISTLKSIASKGRTLVDLLRDKEKLKPSASAAFDLREAIFSFYCPPDDEGISQDEWEDVCKIAKQIHEKLEIAANIERLDVNAREALILKVSNIHTQVSARVSKLTQPGAGHAHS